MTDANHTITIMYGTKTIPPIRYWISFKYTTVPHFFFWTKRVKEYWVCCEFNRLGGWRTYDEAFSCILLANERLKYDPEACSEIIE